MSVVGPSTWGNGYGWALYFEDSRPRTRNRTYGNMGATKQYKTGAPPHIVRTLSLVLSILS